MSWHTNKTKTQHQTKWQQKFPRTSASWLKPSFRALLLLKQIMLFQPFYSSFQAIHLITAAHVKHHKNNSSKIVKINLDCSFAINVYICNNSFITRSKAQQTAKTAKDECIPPKIINLLNQTCNFFFWWEGRGEQLWRVHCT